VSATPDDSRGEAKFVEVAAKVPYIPDSFSMQVHRRLDRYISQDLMRNGIWEPFETKVFCRICKAGDCVADLGANIGWYSVIASRMVGVGGKVFSFEPDKDNFELLTHNLATSAIGNVEAHNLAVGAHETIAKLFLSDDNLGDHRLFDDGIARQSISVEVATLDALFANPTQRPALVKSDTQGSEGKILRGARRLLSENWRPAMILEFWPYGLTNSGSDPMELYSQLAALKYRMFEVSEEHPKLVSVTEERLRARLGSDISPQSMGHVNLLCIHEESPRLTLVEDLIEGA